MKKFICILAALSFIAISACNTIDGIGNDLQKAGQAMSKSAKKSEK